ncbi:MAG: glucose-1-phosphate adenylyltransferase subunit GlgD [Bacillota bacterium]|nr:glucose-1-phosphate adenylyltransferase subunit GlgD [Bacillota bacterium]
MNMAGVIFSNLFDEYFGVLTKNRTVASLPFGGRYRFIDFILSNMSNSNVTNVGIITKYNYNSLMDHLESTSEWDFNRKNGGVFILPPFSTGITTLYHGKLEALFSAIEFLEKLTQEYVVLSDSTVLCNIDYEDALDTHLKSGKDLTVITHRVPSNCSKKYALLIKADDNKNVTDLIVDYPAMEDGELAGMGMYIMERVQLITAIKDAIAKGRHHLEKDFFQKEFNEGKIGVNYYEFRGSVLCNTNISSYYDNNLRLITDEKLKRDLFDARRPIFTKIRDEVPTYYGKGAQPDNCLIADGCRIFGSLYNSVLFREVKIGSGAIVKNSIIMQGSEIGEGCVIENAILDKNVTITPGVKLTGARNAPIIIEKGEIV